MSIDNCLTSALDQGEISEREAAWLRNIYEGYRRKAAQKGTATAAMDAQAATARRMAADAALKKRRLLLQALAQKKAVKDTLTYRTAKGEADLAEGTIALLEHYGSAPFQSMEGLRKAIVGQAHAELTELLQKFERTALTGRTPNRADLDNVVREAFGESTGDPAAKALAQAWADVADGLRVRFNKAGGDIGKLEGWGLPQSHDPKALLNAGKQTWKDAIRPRIDLARMRHPVTGDEILEEELDGILDRIWGDIVTNGWASREPSQTTFGRGAIASQHAEHRFLVFKSSNDWLAYQRDFGQGNPFASMMNHINLMARDIAAVERLGPNPNAMLTFLKQRIEKAGQEKKAGDMVPFAGSRARADSRSRGKIRTIENMWEAYRGNAEVAVDTQLAAGFSITRNWLTSSILGSAILSALPTDPIYQAISRRFVGIPALSTLHGLAGQIRKSSRMEAVRGGLILDSAMHVLGTEARYLGTLSGPEWSQVLPDRVLAWQGLTAWTQAGRHSFGLSFQGMLADRAGKSLAELKNAKKNTLERATAKSLERWGFTAEDWDRIRSSVLHERDGATFLRPQEIAAVDEGLAERVLEMILQETEYAVPSGTLRGRSFTRAGSQPGTLWGEIIRSAGMFKSFAVTYALLYGSRAYREFGASRAAGARFAAAVSLTTALGGAVSLWLKDIQSGRDPRPIMGRDGNPLAFAGQAFMQGGGFGIVGDFLLGDLNRFGGGIGATIGGPVADFGTDFIDLTFGNAAQFATGDTTNVAEETRRFVAKNAPGRSLWFWRLAYDRVLMDSMRRLTDPEAEKAFRRRGRYAADLGTDTWWSPGNLLPERAPDLDVTRPGS
ncbi:hypothetical protein FIV06_15805 [Labrenzia sp. THAF191b]|uniref:hypothetical protein n=1 Tax=unclassified Labrenzia TaxID=2648686 RepID=UPI00126906E7|nr:MULTISPECIES: hypothetical protein [unclassified Labrenzia]QFS98893.1 hypothetical protein FIV06_15805 [Labrenzia sp. THAF191b]QFT05207.1 hypothetical protein FIV05_15800 [Labrenzia sp. THAF191a]QFT16751.1 hypothetical protein FIV03_15815 [Labrenzia sp. THAF187b]